MNLLAQTRHLYQHDGADIARQTTGGPQQRIFGLPLLVGVLAFIALCIAVLTRSVQLLEPDDFAYRASIIALTQGHLFLNDAQYQTLLAQLSGSDGPGIAQWVQTATGTWISEKNPGYPFLAAPFQAIGLLRLAPLFYGGLGCVGLYAGARRWLGRWGGTWAVLLFCSSGAALVFAWRATMPTFTDASLVAAGTGMLLWVMLASEATSRRRTVVGMLGFLALDAAVLVRYTNVVLLTVAVIAVLVTRRRSQLPRAALAWWLGSVGGLVALILTFNQVAYGSTLSTGYSSGLITFSLGAVVPNLTHMPAHLVSSMPMLLLALAAPVWMVIRLVRRGGRHGDAARRVVVRRDATIGAALAAGWLAIWGLYAAYDWTVMTATGPNSTVQVIRFYVPAIGLIALLAAWSLVQLPRWLAPILLVVLITWGSVSLSVLATGGFSLPGGGMHTPPGGGQGPGYAHSTGNGA
jgi:hypothetical protein